MVTALVVLFPLWIVRSADWLERYSLKFLGSVQVPYHKGNEVLCAAMQKVCTRVTIKAFFPHCYGHFATLQQFTI